MCPVGLYFLSSVTSVLVFSSDLSKGDLCPLKPSRPLQIADELRLPPWISPEKTAP
jgi:hypothetical protein